jgi:oligopeptide transport system substrate-binding protein
MSKGDYDLAFGSWIADFDDPINFLEVFKTKHVGTNNTNWESLDYIKAIDASYHCATAEDRLVALKRSEQILIDQMPIIPLYNKSLVHMQRENLKDVLLTKTGTLDFKWAYISE